MQHQSTSILSGTTPRAAPWTHWTPPPRNAGNRFGGWSLASQELQELHNFAARWSACSIELREESAHLISAVVLEELPGRMQHSKWLQHSPYFNSGQKSQKGHIFLRGLEWVCFAHPALLCSMSLLVQFIDFDIPSTDVYHIYHERNCPQRRPRGLLKHRSRSGKPLALTGISGKGWGNRGASLSKLDKLFPNEIHSAAALTREVFPSQVRLEHLALWIFHQFFHIGLQWLPSCFEFELL